MASITFESDSSTVDGILYGRISLGDLDEGFGSTYGPWTARDYRSHWHAAVQEALTGKDVTIVTDWNPGPTTSGMGWVLHWIDDRHLALQNRLLVNEWCFVDPGSPTPETIQVPGRRTATADGHPISEWCVTRGELEALGAALALAH